MSVVLYKLCKMRVWKFKNLLLLLFICYNIIYFFHNSAFQVTTAMCTAGRPATFYYAPFGEWYMGLIFGHRPIQTCLQSIFSTLFTKWQQRCGLWLGWMNRRRFGLQKGGSQEHMSLITIMFCFNEFAFIVQVKHKINSRLHKFLALFWYVCFLRLAISTHVYLAENAAYFHFNSWLSFQRLCRLLWG